MAWYHTDWGYRVKVTSQNAKVFEDVTNWVYYIPLSDLPAGFWSNVDTNGEDVRVTTTDGQTECAIALSSFDGVGNTGALFWKHNSSSTGDVDYYIYYGASGKSLYADNATYGRYNCFNSIYNRVYMLDEDPSTAGASGIKNSVANTEHGTDGGSGISQVSGKLEKDAIDFTGPANDDRIDMGSSDFVVSFPLTLLVWGKYGTTTGAVQVLMGRYNNYLAGERVWHWHFRGTDQIRFQKSQTSGSTHQVDSTGAAYDGGDTNVYRLWSVSIDSAGTTCTHYKDEANIGSGSLTNSTIMSASGMIPRIAASNSSELGGDEIEWESDATFDMAMLGKSAWSQNRVKTWYQQTADPTNFWSVGTQEAQPASTFKPQLVINI